MIFSLNPLIVMVGIMLTCMAVFTSIDTYTHINSMKGNFDFMFWGSSFSMAIAIWMMGFFGILAIDVNNSPDFLIVKSIVSVFCSFIITSFSFVFLQNKKRKRNLLIGSVILSFAVLVTHIITLSSINEQYQYNIVLLIISFVLISLFFVFSFWLVFYSQIIKTSPLSVKVLAALIVTAAIGQGLLMTTKAAFIDSSYDHLLFDLTIDGYWLPYLFLFLSLLIFAALIIGNYLANKKVEKNNLYAKDIMLALDSSNIIAITNPKGTITYVNDLFVEISKYTREELIGKNHNIINSGFHKPEFFENLWKTLKRGEVWKGEICNKRKDGTFYWVDTTIIPFLDGTGEPYQYVSIRTDITDRKLVEKELESTLKEVQDYKYALDQASIVAITNERGIITKVNDNFCAISQYTKEELIGSDHRILNSGYHSKEFFKNLWKTIGSGEVWKGEVRNKAKDGSYYWVETTIVPFLNENGKPYQYLSIRNNITEKKKQEEMLHRQDKLSALGQLAAGIAHEIRNPLTSMRGYTEFLLLDEKQEDRIEHLEIILEEINRVNNIVEEFMMLAKPKADYLAVKNINTIIKNTISLFSYEAKKKKVVVTLTTNQEEILILCDENRLKQVFLNLFKNSLEAMPSGGKLSIHIEKDNSHVLIIVADTGVGIPQAQLNKIGEPFYTTKETGTGLGLMISFKIIESHQGKIEIESEQNRGTTFTISLPIVNDTEE